MEPAFEEVLVRYGAREHLLRQVQLILEETGLGQQFAADSWYLGNLARIKDNGNGLHLRFKMRNSDLKVIFKTYLLITSFYNRKRFKALERIVRTAHLVDASLGDRALRDLKTRDFHDALERTTGKSGGLRHKTAVELERFGAWLTRELDLHIRFKHDLKFDKTEGDFDLEAAIEVALRLFGLCARPDLSEEDRFYLALVVVLVATGLRLGEVLTLPYDCLVDEDGLAVRHKNSKDNEPLIRFVVPELRACVRASVGYLQRITEPGRVIARHTKSEGAILWNEVARDDEATRYFLAQLASVLTSDHPIPHSRDGVLTHPLPEHFGGAIAAYDRSHVNMGEVASRLGVTTDALSTRVCDQIEEYFRRRLTFRPKGYVALANLTRLTAQTMRTERSAELRGLKGCINLALKSGAVLPMPERDAWLEARYIAKDNDLFCNELDHRLGVDEALLVIPEYLLSQWTTKYTKYQLVTKAMLVHWLSRPDSAIRRFGLQHASSGGYLKTKAKDARTLIMTLYELGGMSPLTISLMFGKTNVDETYFRVPSQHRQKQLKGAYASYQAKHGLENPPTSRSGRPGFQESAADITNDGLDRSAPISYEQAAEQLKREPDNLNAWRWAAIVADHG